MVVALQFFIVSSLPRSCVCIQATWPEYFTVAEAPHGSTMAYIFGKAEGRGENWHGHVTAVTVAPEFRRLGLAQQLMHSLETISEHLYVNR